MDAYFKRFESAHKTEDIEGGDKISHTKLIEYAWKKTNISHPLKTDKAKTVEKLKEIFREMFLLKGVEGAS